MEIKLDSKSLAGIFKFIFAAAVLVFMVLTYLKLDSILVQVDGKTMKSVMAHGFDYQKGYPYMLPAVPNGVIVQGPVVVPEATAVLPEKPTTTKEKPKKDGK